MEIHFVNVCNGNGMPCSKEEKEWFSFLENYRKDKEYPVSASRFSYEYGLPGMAELDAILDQALDDFENISKKIPIIGNFKPSGEYLMNDLYNIGGSAALINYLIHKK